MKYHILSTSFKNIFLLSVCIGIITSIYSYYKYHPVIKKQEEKISMVDKINLYIIRAIHYTMSTFIGIYVFFVEISLVNELLAIGLVAFMILHWLYLGECMFSVAEKKILDKKYIRGSTPRYEPFAIMLSRSFENPEYYEKVNQTHLCMLFLLGLRFLYALYIK